MFQATMTAVAHQHLPFQRQTFPQHGQIQVIFGPMFSGKTTELIRRVKRYGFANYNCLLVKYAKDLRYDDICVATHDRQVAKAVSCTELKTIENTTSEYDVIGIDEGQFFPDVVTFSEKMANKGKTVIVAALDGTFQRKGFGSILDLVPLAENVIKLSAVCMNCFGEGSFTKRFGSETEVEVIGGAEKYMASCRLCHFKKLDRISNIENTKENKENINDPIKKHANENKVNELRNPLKHKTRPGTCLQPIENIDSCQPKKIKLAVS